MSEAPEWIWAQDAEPSECNYIGGGWWDEKCGPTQYAHMVEYVRADRIEKLEDEMREMALDLMAADNQAAEAFQAQLEAEDKLAKAVEALEKLARLGNGDRYGNSDGNMIARTTLVELKGDKQP